MGSNIFFLIACNSNEIHVIILSFDTKRSLGPNSIPMYILRLLMNFFYKFIQNGQLVFETVVFPVLCKIAKVIPIDKKDDPLLCRNYSLISLLPIFWKNSRKII